MSKNSIKGNIILSLNEGAYHPGNISNILHEGCILSIFNSVSATLSSPLLEGVQNGILIKDADIEPYKKGHNVVLDKMLESIGLKIIGIVDDKGNELIELNR